MRVVFPDRHQMDDGDEPPPLFIQGSITTFGPEDAPKKKGKKKKHRTAPLGFQPPKAQRRKGK